MFYHAKNGRLEVGGSGMDYISFGCGQKPLVMLPGLGDGLKTVRGTAIPFAVLYRAFAPNYRVYVFSRKDNLPAGYTTGDMASDQYEAMRQLGIGRADLIGVSMGGMIAQELAIRYPDAVNRLILAVTSSCPNELLRRSVTGWIGMAERRYYRTLMTDTAEKMYSDRYLRQNRWLFPLLGSFGAPKSYDRFLVMAEACLSHDAFDRLGQIKAPTLVIGGAQDNTLGGDASEALAGQIPSCELLMYPEYGHGVYEEAKDFNQQVLGFLARK